MEIKVSAIYRLLNSLRPEERARVLSGESKITILLTGHADSSQDGLYDITANNSDSEPFTMRRAPALCEE